MITYIIIYVEEANILRLHYKKHAFISFLFYFPPVELSRLLSPCQVPFVSFPSPPGTESAMPKWQLKLTRIGQNR